MMGKILKRISNLCEFSIHSGGMRPKAIKPEPRTADMERSEVWATADTEFKNSSGAAELNATNVTASCTYHTIDNKCIKADIRD
jgi:hypothetical protein